MSAVPHPNCGKLHRAVRSGEIRRVQSLLKTTPYDEHYYDAGQNSLAAVALECGEGTIYELLVSKRIFLGLHEQIGVIVDKRSTNKQIKLCDIRDIHKKYLNDPNLKHLQKLMSCSKLSHEAPRRQRSEHLLLIAEAFEDLNKLSWIVPILKVASTASNLTIAFDFNRNSVEFLDPTKSCCVLGTTYPEKGNLYVGAKDLMPDGERNNRCQVLGVLIHELTHFVMYLIYNNDAKPYQQEKVSKLGEFRRVFDATKLSKSFEPIIDGVYRYSESHQHAELIVCVPHLAALYKDDDDKYGEVMTEFPDLFDFFEETTLVDLELEYPLRIMKQKVKDLNDLCRILGTLERSLRTTSQALGSLPVDLGSIDKSIFISSNCPQITLRAFYQQSRSDRNPDSYIFADHKSIQNIQIFGLIEETLKLHDHITLIIDCVNGVKEIEQKFKDINITKRIIYVFDSDFDPLIGNKTQIEHSWNHLTRKSRKVLLEKSVCFMGKSMQLGCLLNDLTSVKSVPFNQLLGDQQIKIGSKVELKNHRKLVERKFLTTNSEKQQIQGKDSTIELDFDETFDSFKESRTFLVSDEPGMGKSTTLEMLQSKLSRKFPFSWILFMDLKVHFKAYKKNRVKFKSCRGIAEFFTRKILEIGGFEAEVFDQLFNDNRVVVLMDGLDEICPSFKEFIFGLMTDISEFSENHLWMSTRPHVINDLIGRFNPVVLTLKPFTDEDRQQFFKKHFAKDQNHRQKFKDVQKFLGKFHSRGYSLSNPLLLRMIVEILESDPNQKLAEASMYEVYETFTLKMFENAQKKGPDARKDIAKMVGNSKIVDFYTKKAFEAVFNYGGSLYYRNKFIDSLFKNVSTPTSYEIARVGLMFSDGSGSIYFTHQTFAEFYVAKFFFETIFKLEKQQSEENLEKITTFFIDECLNFYASRCQFSLFLLDSIFKNDDLQNSFIFPEATNQIFVSRLKLICFWSIIRTKSWNLLNVFKLRLKFDYSSIESPFDYVVEKYKTLYC